MIKFFRKIRKNLLAERRIIKYLLYAIGEVILVVIGILIALQLNNYNDSINQNKREQEALHNLKLDFDYNRLALESSISTIKELTKDCLVMLGQTGDKYNTNFDIDSLLQSASSVSSYYPKNGFLMDLINSGNLGIIKSDNLRNKLSSWLPALETIKAREVSAIDYADDVVRYVIKNGSWLNADEMTMDEDIIKITFPKSGFKIDNNNLLKYIEFENMIENQIVFQSSLQSRQEECLHLNLEIIQLLKSEIED